MITKNKISAHRILNTKYHIKTIEIMTKQKKRTRIKETFALLTYFPIKDYK